METKQNNAISRIIACKPSKNSLLEDKYLKFTSQLGIKPDEKPRKYWFFNIRNGDFKNNSASNEGFPEGKMVERKHKARERSPQLISQAKNSFREKNGRLYCEACGFDFEKTYGTRGNDYIEVHHIIPVSEMEPGQKTRIEDVVLVCSNCHRILHRTRPWLKVHELKELLAK